MEMLKKIPVWPPIKSLTIIIIKKNHIHPGKAKAEFHVRCDGLALWCLLREKHFEAVESVPNSCQLPHVQLCTCTDTWNCLTGRLLSKTSLRLDTLAGSTWTLNWRCWRTAPGGIHVVFNSPSKRKVCFFLIWTLRQTFTVDLSNLLQSTCKWVKISTVLMPGLPETENDSRGTLLLGKVGQVSVQEENGGFTIEENVST